jgi:succinate dehydrogenase/fumarate reductase flavoprotein subunit
MKTITTDVVIVGGGAAGCYAALNLQRNGIQPLIVCKGLVGKSGASLFAGNLVISGRLLSNTDENARNTAEFLIKYHNQFLIDQNWARRCGQWIESTYYPELEEAGLYFRRDDAGQVVTSPGKIRSVAANTQGNSGVPFMDLRRKQVFEREIPVLEETAVTGLLQDESGAVCGVVALDMASGELLCVETRAVILATGYADRLYWRSTATREMSADGLAMAYRAGASFVNLEMQWWHTNDCRYPRNWQRMQVYPNPILGSWKSARMVNAAGEEFFNQQQDDPLAFGPYTVQLKRLVRQVRAGKASYEGNYYAGFDHMERAELETYTSYGKLYAQLGLDVSKAPVETAVSAHYRQGGVLVNTETMASTVPGLYVAGGAAGHSNGLIALVTYDGKVAAEAVAKYVVGQAPRAGACAAMAERERSRVEGLLRRRGADGVSPARVKREIRALMWRHMGVEKCAQGMLDALHGLDVLRSDLAPRMGLQRLTRVFNHEWLDALDALNMIDACRLIVLSALNRTESRGPFIRTDYPDIDNVRWLAQNILVPAGNDEVRFEISPYRLPYMRPDFERADNLSIGW